MKKFLSLIVIISLFFCPYVAAAEKTGESAPIKVKVTKTKSKKPTMTWRINHIGRKLLDDNKIVANVTFKLKKTNKVNAYANLKKDVVVFSGLVRLCEYDDELAGIIAHEVGHIVNAHVAKMNLANNIVNLSLNMPKEVQIVTIPIALVYKISSKKWSRLEEFEADATAVDLMVGAGYNPLGMVSILQKITGERYFDFLSTHPSGEKRTLYIYDYIAHTYPQYVEKGFDSESYEEFLAYAQPIFEKREFDNDLMEKHLKKQEKLEQVRKKKYEKYQKAYYRKQEKLKEKELKQQQKAQEELEKAKQKQLEQEQKLKEKESKEQKESAS